MSKGSKRRAETKSERANYDSSKLWESVAKNIVKKKTKPNKEK
jgi:hypothetical protein